MENPRLIEFDTKGNPTEGFLNIVSTDKEIPFDVVRAFWTHDTPINITRGKHAHHKTELLLIAIKGSITVSTIASNGQEKTFLLSKSNIGLYLPKLCWHEMNYSENAIQLVFANTNYNESDYIRDKNIFKDIINQAGKSII